MSVLTNIKITGVYNVKNVHKIEVIHLFVVAPQVILTMDKIVFANNATKNAVFVLVNQVIA